MALTVSNVDSRSEDTWGRQRIRVVDIAFDDSYASGGLSLTPANVGLAEIVAIFLENVGEYTFTYDHADQLLLAFEEGVEVTAATDLSTVATRALIVGR